MRPMIFLLSVVLHFVGCTNVANPVTPAFSYQVNAPDNTFIMSKELEEISGLCVSDDGKYLVAIQDENGIVFYLDKTTGKIEKQIKFWENGDYEDVGVVGKDVYVVKSTGTIYRITKNGDEVEKFNFGLDHENDVEGLAYDSKSSRLLLACKNKVGGGESSDSKRGIYAFDLNKKSLSDKPAYIVDTEAVRQFLKPLPNTETKEKLLEVFQSKEMTFAPSAIAVHPRTGELYLLSAAGNVLLVLDATGKVVHLEKLKKKIHAQPEGLSFDTDGTMYISNEAKDGEPGKVYVFKIKGG